MVAFRSEPAYTPLELTASLLSQFSSPTFSTPGGLARARASFFGRLSKYSVILLSWLIYAYAGETWTSRTAAEANGWRSVTYGGSLFVAVSMDGTNRVMTSSDGITWTSRTAAEANEWRSVTYGGGLFVAVSSNGNNRVMTSSDGITWTIGQAGLLRKRTRGSL